MVAAHLQKSIEQYQQIVEHMQRLDQLLIKGEPEQIQNYTVQLQALQSGAGSYDRELIAEISQDSGPWKSHPLFLQRMQLLEQIVEMNDLLLPRIRGMMSVSAAELAQLKGGRAAVVGYNQGSSRNKKSVRGVG